MYNNPLRYRGYCYDEDTGFYYLKSRYYDPTVGRFLNADDTAYLGASGTAIGWNLFTYCDNSPIINRDSSGHWYISLGKLSKILLYAVSFNPIGTVLVAMGLVKLKAILTAKYMLLLAKLGSFWGPVVNVVLVTVGAVLGLPSILDFASALWDCVMQRKKGLEWNVIL